MRSPSTILIKGDGYYLTNNATTTSSAELMPLWVKKDPFMRWEKKTEIVEGIGEIQNTVLIHTR